MKPILALAFLVLLTVPAASAYYYSPAKGISGYSLNPVYTTSVSGWLNMSEVKVFGDFFRNGTEFANNSFTVQLNVYTESGLWLQDVLLVEVLGDKLNVTPVVNVWNVTGSHLPVANYSVYGGLAVYVAEGEPFTVNLPAHVLLYINVTPRGTVFGYCVNGISGVTEVFPQSSVLQIGGTVDGFPADVELVIGGPGGGSVAYMYVRGNASLQYSGEVPPIAISDGISTGEGAFGFNVTSYGVNDYVAVLGSNGSSFLLWPHESSIEIERHGDTWTIKLTANGMPLGGQEIEAYSLPSLREVFKGFTNSSGEVSFEYNGTYLVAYYPGNTSVLPAIAVYPNYLGIPSSFQNATQRLIAELESLRHPNFSSPFVAKGKVATHVEEYDLSYVYPILGYVAVVAAALIIKVVKR